MNPPPSAEELSMHAKMMINVVVCAIAQKYDISELKKLATSWSGDAARGCQEAQLGAGEAEARRQNQSVGSRPALGSLHHDAMHFHIPGKEDSQADFERSYQAVGRFQQKILSIWDSVKLAD